MENHYIVELGEFVEPALHSILCSSISSKEEHWDKAAQADRSVGMWISACPETGGRNKKK